MRRTVVSKGLMVILLAAAGLAPRIAAIAAGQGGQRGQGGHAGHGGHGGHGAPAGHAPKDAAVPVGSVLAMDVYAQRDTIDLLLAVQAANGPELQHRRSRDGARTWSAPVTIDRGGRSLLPPKRGNDAQIAASGDTLIVAWTMKGTSKYGAGSLAAARSTNGGRTWHTAPSPAEARGQGGQGGQGFTDLAATDRGTFFAAWLDERDGSRGLRLARSTDAGRTWAANVTLDAHTCECCWNTLATFDRDRVAVLYRDKGPRDMALAVSTDAGKSWAPRGVVGKFAWGFEGCPHVGGGLAQSTGDAPRIAAANAGHATAAAATRAGHAQDAAAPLAAARVWHALVWTGAEGKEGVYVLRSPDEGRTWGEPTRLGGGLGHHGAIAARAAHVTAAWDAAVDGAMAIFTSESSDGGLTWSAPQRLSNGGSATHPIAMATTTGDVVLWTERDAATGRVTWVSRPLTGTLTRAAR